MESWKMYQRGDCKNAKTIRSRKRASSSNTPVQTEDAHVRLKFDLYIAHMQNLKTDQRLKIIAKLYNA